MADDIIDLGRYRAEREDEPEDGGVFAVWGGEGERSRLALPVWRALYLVAGNRGGLVWAEGEGPSVPTELNPLFVLDLRQDPPRMDFEVEAVAAVAVSEQAPVVVDQGPRVAVYLGEGKGRRWFLVVDDRTVDTELDDDPKGDLLFLAGECAGLLLHQGLGSPEADPD